MRDFRKLDVWHKAHALTLEIYNLTRGFPPTERYGLVVQLQRAASSIGANLAEGCGRESDADVRRFVLIASGSACEVEYHLLLARDLGFVAGPDYDRLNRNVNEVKRMFVGFAKYLECDPARLAANQPR